MRRSLWLAALCLLAFGLSWAYVGYYLRGGPRIIDATSYLLEARSLSRGSFSFLAQEPTAAFRGRFLLASPDGHALSVIFPPGYPALLSLGVRASAPMLVGPLLGAALVAATYFLGRALGQTAPVALLAAALSAVSAALRYHSADTMSHALCALLMCLALGLSLRRDLRLAPLLAGLCLGWLAATRPVSAAVALTLCGFALHKSGLRAWLWLALGLVPGVALLALHQHTLTGSYFGSTQLAYYAAADAPPGCFRYGFGAGVGCRYEHGDFVTRFLPDGYGARAALRNLWVHLGLFSIDATNAVPLTLLGGYAAFRHTRSPLALASAGVLLQALAYVPFYFDGSYPGGGARFLCEAIPLCQILVARAVFDLRLARFALPVSLLGFLLHARHGHELLRDREGGRPMFEPSTLERAGVERGLVFVDTDHGFNLGHDPGVENPRAGVLVARARKDAHDRELYERLGRPPTYLYAYDPSGARPPALLAYEPPESSRYEGEAEWPARLARGSAYPIHFPCASGGRALRLFPGSVIRLPPPSLGPGMTAQPGLELGWVSTRPGRAELRVVVPGRPVLQLSAEGPGCRSWTLPGPEPGNAQERWGRGPTDKRDSGPTDQRDERPLEVELVRGEGALDYLAGAQLTR